MVNKNRYDFRHKYSLLVHKYIYIYIYIICQLQCPSWTRVFTNGRCPSCFLSAVSPFRFTILPYELSPLFKLVLLGCLYYNACSMAAFVTVAKELLRQIVHACMQQLPRSASHTELETLRARWNDYHKSITLQLTLHPVVVLSHSRSVNTNA